jgi:hypothetical protein
MSDVIYKFYKDKFDSTKPIRGRAEEIRPLGKRRRDWEKITRKDLGQGWFAYCAKLYNTECVEFHPNGDIVVRTDGWSTPSTADFIHTHSPFVCFKKNKKLWVRYVNHGSDEERARLYPLTPQIHFKWLGGNNYEPAEEIKVKKLVINRSKAKAAREPIKPFLSWVKTFLAMSDGWVMHESRKQILGWSGHGFTNKDLDNKETLNSLVNALTQAEPELAYMRVLCEWCPSLLGDRRNAEAIPREYEWGGNKHIHTLDYYDYRVSFDPIKRRIYKLVESQANVHDVVELKPTDKAMTNVI